MEIDAIGVCAAVIVTCDDPVAPPAVAVIATGPPAATPVTTPVLDTVAMAVFALDQVVVTFVQLVCVTAALSVPVAPAITLSVGGVTATALTTHCGVVPDGPSEPPHAMTARADAATRKLATRGETSRDRVERLTGLLLGGRRQVGHSVPHATIRGRLR
jgi:hypothetical protein